MKTEVKPKSEIAQVFSKVLSEYQKNKSKKLMMIDSLIVFALVSAIVQVTKNFESTGHKRITILMRCIESHLFHL